MRQTNTGRKGLAYMTSAEKCGGGSRNAPNLHTNQIDFADKAGEKVKIFCGRHKRNLPERGKSVSAFPLPTPLRYSNKPVEAAERRKGEERCNGPLHATTTMDAVIKASLASLSLTAAVAHRLAAGSSSGSDAAAAGEQREGDELKRKAYTTLRNRYFGAYFFALFGIRIRGVTIPLFTGSESGSGIVQRLKIFG